MSETTTTSVAPLALNDAMPQSTSQVETPNCSQLTSAHHDGDHAGDDDGVVGNFELEPEITPMRSHTRSPPPPAADSIIDPSNVPNDGTERGRIPVLRDHMLPTPKKSKKKKKRAGPGASPAMHTVHGFTPVDSGAEDSDASSRFDSPRPRHFATASPVIRPASPGISALKMQLDALSVSGSMPGSRAASQTRSKLGGSSTPSSMVSGGSDQASDDGSELCSYEVEIDQDFVSASVDEKSKSHSMMCRDQLASQIYRKMNSEDFTILKCLGKGSYGTVWLVKQNATGRLYAQKQFKKASITVTKKLVEQTKTERSILESVNRHPFIVNLYYAFQDREKLYLILQYASGGELFHHLAMEKFFTEDVAAFYIAELILALDHLHHKVGIVYRDLKPENCLLDSEGHLLLTDFGLSKVAVDDPNTPGGSRCNSQGIGTFEYMAPEVIRGDHGGYGKTCDWWSLGALAHDLLTGSPPFGGNNKTKIMDNILKKKLVLPYYLSPDAKDFLTRLLRKEPNKRLGAKGSADVAIMKRHRFFRKIDWAKLERRELEPPITPFITDPALAENFSSEFTSLALSAYPTEGERRGSISANDPFGGFSFVASSSLLNSTLMGIEE